MLKLFRVQLSILFIATLSFTAYALASSETGPAGNGGEGANVISGWTIFNVQYHLSDNSGDLSSVEFDLDKSADVVKISLDPSNAMFFDCTNHQGVHWVCDIYSPVKVAAMNELRVVALQTK